MKIGYEYTGKIHQGIFVERVNRFVAKVKIDGKLSTVHVKNTGKLPELLKNGATCYLEESPNPNRKTKYSLISIYYNDTLVNIDSQVPNKIIHSALKFNYIKDYENLDNVYKEYTVGSSRLDFMVEKDKQKTFIEVKGANLVVDDTAMFPDAVTTRGSRHLEELINLKKKGHRSMVIFVVQRIDASSFAPNYKTDKTFTDKFYKALNNKVDVRVYTSEVGKNFIYLHKEIPFAKRKEK